MLGHYIITLKIASWTFMSDFKGPRTDLDQAITIFRKLIIAPEFSVTIEPCKGCDDCDGMRLLSYEGLCAESGVI